MVRETEKQTLTFDLTVVILAGILQVPRRGQARDTSWTRSIGVAFKKNLESPRRAVHRIGSGVSKDLGT